MSGDDQKDVKTAEGSEDHINLKVVGQDGNTIHFKIKKHTPFRKLMNAYCNKTGLSMNSVRFRFDGEPIGEDDSPLGRDMEEGDTIEVFQQQTGGTTLPSGMLQFPSRKQTRNY